MVTITILNKGRSIVIKLYKLSCLKLLIILGGNNNENNNK